MEWYSVLLWFVIAGLSGIYYYFKRQYSYWKDRGVPYAEPIFPFGNIPMRRENLKNIIENIYAKKDGSQYVGGYFFSRPVVVATDLDFIQDVLVKDFSDFHERGLYYNEKDDPLSAHLLAVEGQKWRSLRGKLSPTFTSGKIKFMYPTVVEVAERFRNTLGKIIETEKIIEIKDLLARFTTDVIGTCAFGIECNSLKDPNAEFREYGRKFVDEPQLSIAAVFFTIQFPNFARKLGIRIIRPDVSKFFMETVRETIDLREKNNIRRNDFMDLLIQLKNNDALEGELSHGLGKLTFEDVAAQAFIFFLAGFETSSTTMMFALYELALNQDVQEKARREIEKIMPKYNGELTYEALMEITYIDQIISETLRKYPPIATLLRKSAADYKVRNSNRIIKEGITVLIPAYAIHHDPAIFPDPELFDPERFSPEQIKARHPMSFLAFGNGPRNCIGLRFGRMQSRVGLITLLRNYRFKTCSKTPIPMAFSRKKFILSPVDGIYLEIEKLK